jgi:hypothetical protein
MFCATNECDKDTQIKNDVSYQNGRLPKLCDTNKIVTKMDVIIKRVLVYSCMEPELKPQRDIGGEVRF